MIFHKDRYCLTISTCWQHLVTKANFYVWRESERERERVRARERESIRIYIYIYIHVQKRTAHIYSHPNIVWIHNIQILCLFTMRLGWTATTPGQSIDAGHRCTAAGDRHSLRGRRTWSVAVARPGGDQELRICFYCWWCETCIYIYTVYVLYVTKYIWCFFWNTSWNIEYRSKHNSGPVVSNIFVVCNMEIKLSNMGIKWCASIQGWHSQWRWYIWDRMATDAYVYIYI